MGGAEDSGGRTGEGRRGQGIDMLICGEFEVGDAGGCDGVPDEQTRVQAACYHQGRTRRGGGGGSRSTPHLHGKESKNQGEERGEREKRERRRRRTGVKVERKTGKEVEDDKKKTAVERKARKSCRKKIAYRGRGQENETLKALRVYRYVSTLDMREKHCRLQGFRALTSMKERETEEAMKLRTSCRSRLPSEYEKESVHKKYGDMYLQAYFYLEK